MSIDVLKPIPNMDGLRAVKKNYRAYPIDRDNPLFDEPLLAICEYGIDGVSYYSQPNNATIDPVPGVSPDIYLRKSLVEKLAITNDFLKTDLRVQKALGSPVKFYVRDGLRSPDLQGFLHDTVIPGLLRSQHPEWTEAQLQARADQVIASPQWSETSMPPHFTGGAVDLTLVTEDTGEVLNTGFKSVHLGGEAIHTDFLEKVADSDLALAGLEQALIVRRVLHNVLVSDAPEVGGLALANNPTETWHYSYGDQFWALLTGHPAALYGVPKIPPELLTD